MQTQTVLCLFVYFIEVITDTTKATYDFKKSHYYKIAKTPSFVDKSLLIEEVLKNDFVLITAPHRFGKSTNMDMVKTFLEIVVDENGTSISEEETNRLNGELPINCNLFKQLNLKIVRQTQLFYKHCGQYPVIYIDFNSVLGKYVDPNLDTFKSVLQQSFQRHQYLLNSYKISETEKQEFNIYYENKRISQAEAKNGLKFLSKLLHGHFNKTVFVLIDDLDAPVLKDLFNPHSDVFKTLDFINEMVSDLFRNNSHVKRGLINSRIQLPIDDVIKHFSFLSDHGFAEFYGFTEIEVDGLVEKFKMSKICVKNWYNGYTVTGKSVRIYNTKSVVKYLKSGTLKSYWPYTDDIKYLGDLFLYKTVNPKIFQLINNKSITIQTTNKTVTKQIQHLKRFVSFPVTCINNEDIANTFILFLFDNGYLNIVNKQNNTIHFELPNLEINKELSIKFYSLPFYINKFNFDFEQINLFLRALSTLYREQFTFRNFLRSVTDLFTKYNVMLPKSEKDLYNILLAFIRDCKDFEVVDSEGYIKNSNTHFIVIVRKDGSTIILNLRYKRGSAFEGLQQLLSNKFYKILQNPTYNTLTINYEIYIGLHLDETRNASISYLIHSKYINKATNMTSYVK